MTKQPFAVPLRPDYSAVRGRPSDHLIRAVYARSIGFIEKRGAEQIIAERWPDDAATPLIIKTATAPATMTTSGWASHLVQTAVSDFILNLGAASAGSALLRHGIQQSFDGSGAIFVPSVGSAASAAGFVGEAAPIPVRQFTVSGVTLSPRKFASLAIFTRDLFQHSTPNVEAILRAVLTESVAASLDARLLDATAGDATRPAGLRNGISATSASSTTPDTDTMFDDLTALVAVVQAVSGASPIIIIAAPKQAAAIKMRQPNFPFEVLVSSGLTAGMVVAIASNCLVSAMDPAPRIEVGDQAAVHFEDTTPLAIGTVGAPPTVAAPTRSLWQAGLISVRIIFEVSWGLRSNVGLAWTQTVTW
jgi:Phage capsid family